MVINGNNIGLNGNYGIYWHVMDSIDGMLNPIGKKCPKHTTNLNFVMVWQEKANGL